jgi:hypothetical protein
MGNAQSRAIRDARFVDARCDDNWRMRHALCADVRHMTRGCAMLNALMHKVSCTDARCRPRRRAMRDAEARCKLRRCAEAF